MSADPLLGPSVEAVVRESTRITPESTDEVRQITLQVDDPAFRYREGQTIGIVIPGPHPYGRGDFVRRYSIANEYPAQVEEPLELSILVRRCFYIDEVNGERYPGIASNYICDRKAGDRLTLTGPFRAPFQIPDDPSANLLMISTGTGIAPFRAFIRKIYKQHGGWQGKVRLFYGATSGMDLLYMNDLNDDISNYYDEETFKAFNGLVERPLAREEEGLERSLQENAEEIWTLMQQPESHVYLAGLQKVYKVFNQEMERQAGSAEAWNTLNEEMQRSGRLSTLLYD
jgi:ferredoxin--NADP+ reductase